MGRRADPLRETLVPGRCKTDRFASPPRRGRGRNEPASLRSSTLARQSRSLVSRDRIEVRARPPRRIGPTGRWEGLSGNNDKVPGRSFERSPARCVRTAFALSASSKVCASKRRTWRRLGSEEDTHHGQAQSSPRTTSKGRRRGRCIQTGTSSSTSSATSVRASPRSPVLQLVARRYLRLGSGGAEFVAGIKSYLRRTFPDREAFALVGLQQPEKESIQLEKRNHKLSNISIKQSHTLAHLIIVQYDSVRFY